MKKGEFFGGVAIRVTDAETKPLESANLYEYAPRHVYIPMSQHVGAPAEPTVKQGDEVTVGQVIGKSDASTTALVHASVSGKILDVKKTPQTNGKESMTVIVENDGQNTLCDTIGTKLDHIPADPEEIVEAVRRAGIVGMGGAMFPTHIKLKVDGKKIDFCLINGAECEPQLRADDALMRQSADRIVKGCLAAMKATGAKEAIFGIESNKPEAIAAVRTACENQASLRVVELPHMYPQGGEKQLIQALTGREVPEGKLPADIGVVVLNVATAAAVCDALESGMPLVRRICTVTGDVSNPRNVCYPLGTRVVDLLEFCGGFSGTPSRVIVGGPMMGRAQKRLDVPLTKGANGIVVINREHDAGDLPEHPCIQCGRCVDACPMRLMPQFLDRYSRGEKWELCRRFHAQSCINCGCCTYVCPSRRALAENIVAAKEKLSEMDKQKKSQQEGSDAA